MIKQPSYFVLPVGSIHVKNAALPQAGIQPKRAESAVELVRRAAAAPPSSIVRHAPVGANTTPSATHAMQSVVERLQRNAETASKDPAPDTGPHEPPAAATVPAHNSFPAEFSAAQMLGTTEAGRPPSPAARSTLPAALIASPADLGRLVRAARETRDMSQQQVADLAGVGRRFLSELENGKATIELGRTLLVTAAAGVDLFALKR